MKNKFTKLFTLLVMAAMSMGAWAAAGAPVSIPATDIDWTKANVSAAEATVTDLGSVQGKATVTFALHSDVEQEYFLTVKSGGKTDGTTPGTDRSMMRFTLKDNSSNIINTKRFKVVDTDGSWGLENIHLISLGSLNGDYTLILSVDQVYHGSHAGNFGNLTIQPASYFTQTIPNEGESVIDLEHGIHGGNGDPRYESSNQNIGYVYNNGWSEYIVKCTENGVLNMSMGLHKYQNSQVKVSIYNAESPEEAAYVQTYDIPASSNYATQTFALDQKPIAAGLKKIRLDYISESPSYVFNYNNLKFVKRAAADMTYEREFAHMNLNTLCFPYEISSYTGATFYTILSTEVEAGQLTKLELEEHTGSLAAGVPYFYDPDPASTKLTCTYHSGSTTSEAQVGVGGLTGVYLDGSAVPEGSYVTVNNQLYRCGAGVTMAEFRAYVTPTAYSRTAAPGRRRLTIGGKNAPTGVEQFTIQNSQCTNKVLRDGQVVIIRGDKMYNVMGQEL